MRGVGCVPGDEPSTIDPELAPTVALDVFSSLRSTALVTLVAASFSSPIVLKSDAVASVTEKLGSKGSAHEVAPPERVLAGGVEFEKPAAWGELGASATESGAGEDTIGTVVAGLCPGGSAGATCKDETRLTFVAYTGDKGHELPLLTQFEEQLDHQLHREFPGFAAGESKQLPGADGIRYLDYGFTWGKDGDHRAHQRVAAFRHADGSGVVIMAAGPKLESHAKAIDAFLASAHEPVEEH
jgi:hypothetical protein